MRIGLIVVDVEKRRRAIEPQPDLFSTLEKNAFRTLLIDTPEPFEIVPAVREIAVVGEAERHADVGRFVSLDPVTRTNDVDR